MTVNKPRNRFEVLAEEIGVRNAHVDRVFRAHYGIGSSDMEAIYQRYLEGFDSIKKEYLLWTFDFLKRSPTYDVLVGLYGKDPKTLRKWIKKLIDVLDVALPEVIYIDKD